jgi:hypothetical protein
VTLYLATADTLPRLAGKPSAPATNSAELCYRGVHMRHGMRSLNIVSGIAVLLTTLAFGHLVYHFFSQSPAEQQRNPVFLVGLIVAIVVGIFSLVGACLLLLRRPLA